MTGKLESLAPLLRDTDDEQAGEIVFGLADFNFVTDGTEGFLGDCRGLADQGDLMVVLYFADVDQEVFDRDEFDRFLAGLVFDGFVEGVNLAEGGAVGFEADAFDLGLQEGFGEGDVHLPFAEDDIEPAGFHGGLFFVSEVGDEIEVFCGEEADGIVAAEVREIRKIGRRRE